MIISNTHNAVPPPSAHQAIQKGTVDVLVEVISYPSLSGLNPTKVRHLRS